MLKNAYLKNSPKLRGIRPRTPIGHRRLGVPPPDPHAVNPAY